MFKKFRNMSITLKASIAYTVCNILQKGISFFTLPLFTRMLTTEQYGQFTVYSSWSAIFSIILTLNLAYGSFSTAMTKFEDRRDRYISSISGLCTCLCAIFLVVYLPFRGFWNGLLEMPTILVLLMVAETITTFSFMCWTGKKRFEYKYKSIIALSMSIAVISPVTAYIFILNSDNKGIARIFGCVLITIIIGGTLYVLSLIRGKKFFDMEFWKYALGFNLPLIPYYLSQVIFNQSDRIMIGRYCGTGKAAIYGVAYTLAMILTVVLNAINNAYVPWFYGKIKAGKEKENQSIANGIALLMAVMIIAIISMAPEIIYLMAGKEYAEAVFIVPPVAMSLLLLFYAQLFINVEFYYESKSLLVWASLLSAVTNIVLNMILIPRISYIAAGYTTLVSYILFAVMNYLAMKKMLAKKGKKNESFDLKTLTLIFAGFAAFSFLMLALYDYPIVRYSIVGVLLIAICVKAKTIISFVKSFVSKSQES